MATPLTPQEDAIFAKYEQKLNAARKLDEIQDIAAEAQNEIKDLIQTSILPELDTPHEFQETHALATKDISEYSQFFHSHCDHMSTIGSNNSIPLYDYDLITNAKAFMMGPVCMLNKKVYEAVTARFKSLPELKHYLKYRSYILYYAYVSSKTYQYKPDTFELERLETPETEYYFRGAFID